MDIRRKKKDFPTVQTFSRIVDVISFAEHLEELTAEEAKAITDRLCKLPRNSENPMSLEEIIFWAGIATGMDIFRNMSEDRIDYSVGERIFHYSSLFACSTKNVVVDLTLDSLEAVK
ncbi:MAG TPA: hypothetical protein VEG30_08210 [Terriglobales bacterium]|nr:hypothetical protein [Terriglobales bacterium]